MSSSDVLIIGAGAIGSAVAYYCTQQGLDVTVVEAGKPAGETSSKGEGHVRISDKTLAPEIELAQYSLSLYRDELSEQADYWDYQLRGGVMVSSTDASLESLHSTIAKQRQLGIEVEMLDVQQLRELEPALTAEVAGGALYPDDARLAPPKMVTRLLELAQQTGARLHTQTRVTGFLRDGERVTGVQTSRGDFSAGAVVNAGGPWSGQVAKLAGAYVPVEPRRGYVLVTEATEPRVFHEVSAAEYLDTVSSSEADLQGSAVIEALPSREILLGSSRERMGFSAEGGKAAVDLITRNAQTLFPFLQDVQIVGSRFGFRPYSPDHLPIIGPDAAVEGLWNATGHEGAGAGLAAGSGKLLAQVLSGSPPDLNLAPFSPARFISRGERG
ncbi:NAD(P)/FAD-dependent oxidoreductase [Nesterenkonia muleiensis]|uniref:NAD(P)/FAD-dependent oxidoreductase n=1 Tax=Nesterenkonia muleiensis TaxID=2282648 RepID=UPI00192E62EF|nr:FAD-dependent oxidoreductase [Nesterenkonia muleiensis]